eukprot:3601893-Pleurochrysis_carterae.AAC.1
MKLTQQRKTFLSMTTKERGQVVYDAIYFHTSTSTSQDLDDDEAVVKNNPVYTVGPSPSEQRQ